LHFARFNVATHQTPVLKRGQRDVFGAKAVAEEEFTAK
jgi:hypothetical protein